MRDIPRNTMIVIVAAILAASVIGAAYAYSASTVNSNNTVETHYISMTMSDDGTTPSYSDDFDFNIEWNTITSLGNDDKHNIKYVVDEEQATPIFTQVAGLVGPSDRPEPVTDGDPGVVKVGQVVLTLDVSHLDKSAFKLSCTPTLGDTVNGMWYFHLKTGKDYATASAVADPSAAADFSKWGTDGKMTSATQVSLSDSIAKIEGSETVVVIFSLYAWAENGVVYDSETVFDGMTELEGSFTFKAEPVSA